MSAPTKNPVGRPAEHLTGKPERYCVSLDRRTHDLAVKFGKGILSAGIRLAVKEMSKT